MSVHCSPQVVVPIAGERGLSLNDPSEMWRRRRLELALLVASIVVSLVFAEAILRVLGRGPLRVNPPPVNFWRYDALLGWHNVPGADGVFDHPKFQIHVHTNSKGLRDREYAYERNAGTRRILVIGDSF